MKISVFTVLRIYVMICLFSGNDPDYVKGSESDDSEVIGNLDRGNVTYLYQDLKALRMIKSEGKLIHFNPLPRCHFLASVFEFFNENCTYSPQ